MVNRHEITTHDYPHRTTILHCSDTVSDQTKSFKNNSPFLEYPFVLYFYFVLSVFPISGLFLNTFFLSSIYILKDDYKLHYATYFKYAAAICQMQPHLRGVRMDGSRFTEGPGLF